MSAAFRFPETELVAAEIEALLAELFELQSRQRVHRYLETGWIDVGMAERIFVALNEVAP